MADKLEKEDAMDVADDDHLELEECAVLDRALWLTLLKVLPAELAVEVRSVGMRDGNFIVIPKLIWLFLIALENAQSGRH